MHGISTEGPSQEFVACWVAAGNHLELQARRTRSNLFWLKADPYPPYLAHLSFRLGNQLFYLRVEDSDGRLPVPGVRSGLLRIAGGNRGHACILPMRYHQGRWLARASGWSLIDALTEKAVDPPSLVTGDLIEMTDWELHDFAVEMVWRRLEKEKRSIMSRQGDPEVDPSLWFIGDHGPEWVVVRAVRYPTKQAPRPTNLLQISENCARLSRRGHFASVSVANARDPFDPTKGVLPLWRGGPMNVSYEGLQSI